MTQAPAPTRQAYPAAELDRRFYAFAIDRLLAWGVYAGAGYAAYRLLIEPGDLWAGIGVIAGVVLVVGLGFAVLLGVAGVSPGKALVGLRVVRHDDGRPIGVPAALLRTVVLGIAALPTFGLGVATLAWTAVVDASGRRRGAHDRLSGAIVVDVRPQPEPEADADERPRQIVNLTAMRLMPVPQEQQVETPPAPPPPAAAPQPAPQRAPLPEPASAPAAPSPPVVAPAQPAPGRHAAQPPPPPPPAARPVPDSPPPAPPGGPDHPVATQRIGGIAAGTTWRVTFDTGESFVVEGLALVGRRPEARDGESVRHLMPLRSTDMSLSKTHAQFQVVPDGARVVMDRGSTNGSVLVRQGVAKALSPGRPSTLVEGDKVRFGDREMTVGREA
jgi:uncharacterized RDD family membrane protein YckC